MQEKTLLKQKHRASNIHSMDFGSVSYDIFGSPYQKSGSFLANDSLDFGYLGKPYNADTELYDYEFRDYSPEIARFTSVDPIRDGRNWFSYVVNDPVNYVDLWGLCGSENDGKKTITQHQYSKWKYIPIEGVGINGSSLFLTTEKIEDNEVTVSVSAMFAGQNLVDSSLFYGSATLYVNNQAVEENTLEYPSSTFFSIGEPFTFVGTTSFDAEISSEDSVSIEYDIDLTIKTDYGVNTFFVNYSNEEVSIK